MDDLSIDHKAAVVGPSVSDLKLSPAMSGFEVVPIAVFDRCCREACKWQWFIETSDDGCWMEVSSSSTFSPDIQHVGRNIKVECVPSDGHRVGMPCEATSKETVTLGPVWGGVSERQQSTSSLLMSQQQLRIITYNILLEEYLRKDHSVYYQHCLPHALEDSFRQQLIVKELKGYNADILCLQEVGPQVYINYLQPALRAAGYKGLFAPRINNSEEGLATFYRSDKLTLLNTSDIVIGDTLINDDTLAGLSETLRSEQQETWQLVSTLDRVCQVLIISNGKRPLIVVNAHLCWMADFELVRLIQSHVILHCVDRLRKESHLEHAVVIFCGDLNHEPSSDTFRYINEGEIQLAIGDNFPNRHCKLSHDLCLTNATGTPPYSWLVEHSQQLVDYVYVEKRCFRVLQAIPLPTEEELKQDGLFALPSCRFGSDHVALGVDVELLNI